MNRPIFAASISLILLLSSSPAGAWYQWYHQSMPYAPAPADTMTQFQGPGLGAWPGVIPPPWFWFLQQPNYATLWMMPAMTSGVFVEQSQTQFGYQIRVHAPEAGVPSLDISVHDGVIVIKSRSASQSRLGGPMQQSGWTTRWITLPPDANLGAMQMSRGSNVVKIFVPRFG